ncbi:2OG-Fe(II) oxygenase family protein [Toxoplasma gondii p89]|uniref:2OG-Fe(II) oxygenase family protein n=1 Tax=Toxoplasma gondii p89 TaxID=943119 RepID=A0A086K7M1_TOXGO|nr:2OG-Fe(II) oxygenase family protein [Toxoplasma gondii p89]
MDSEPEGEARTSVPPTDSYKERETLLRSATWSSLFLSQVVRLTASREKQRAQSSRKSPEARAVAAHAAAEGVFLACGRRRSWEATGREKEEDAPETQRYPGRSEPAEERETEPTCSAQERRPHERERKEKNACEGGGGEEGEGGSEKGEWERWSGESENSRKASKEALHDFEITGGVPLLEQSLRFDCEELCHLLNRATFSPSEDSSVSSRPSSTPCVTLPPVSLHPVEQSAASSFSPCRVAGDSSSSSCSSLASSPRAEAWPSVVASSLSPSRLCDCSPAQRTASRDSSAVRPSSPSCSSSLCLPHASFSEPTAADCEDVSISFASSAPPLSIYEVCSGALFLPSFLSEFEQLLLARECLSVYSRPPHVCNVCSLFTAKEAIKGGASVLASAIHVDQEAKKTACPDSRGRDAVSEERRNADSATRPPVETPACKHFEGDLCRETPSLFVKKQLHWVTLGRHYDWSRRSYEDAESAKSAKSGNSRPPSSSGSPRSSSSLASALSGSGAALKVLTGEENNAQRSEEQGGEVGQARVSRSSSPSHTASVFASCSASSLELCTSSRPCSSSTSASSALSGVCLKGESERKTHRGSMEASRPSGETSSVKTAEAGEAEEKGENGQRQTDKKRESEAEGARKEARREAGRAGLPLALEKLCDDILQFTEPFLQGPKEGRRPRMNAAILNVYRKGDRLRGHRDDAERAEAPLISISLGQPAIFLLGGDSRRVAPKALVLRSGDVLVLSGAARWAVHGVPKLLYYTPVVSSPAPRRKRKPRGPPAPPAAVKSHSARDPTNREEWRSLPGKKTWPDERRVASAVRDLLAEAGLTQVTELHAEGTLRLLKSENRRDRLHASATSHWVDFLESWQQHRHADSRVSGRELSMSRGECASNTDPRAATFEPVWTKSVADVDAWLGELRLNLSCRYDNNA